MSFENIEDVVEVVVRGIEVLESKDDFIHWLKSPIRALGYKTPLSMLETKEGIQLVLDVLGRIEYGIIG